MSIKTLKYYLVIALVAIFQIYSAFGAEKVEGEGKWNKPGIPHKGWTHMGVEDLKEITGVCGMCDKTRIRYLHTVSHDDHEDLTVGRDCAEKMCEDYENPKKRETQAKTAARQREVEAKREADQRAEEAQRVAERIETIKRNWLDSSQWRPTAKGGYSKKIGNDWLNLFKQGQIWKYVYINQFSATFPTLKEALQASYVQYGKR